MRYPMAVVALSLAAWMGPADGGAAELSKRDMLRERFQQKNILLNAPSASQFRSSMLQGAVPGQGLYSAPETQQESGQAIAPPREPEGRGVADAAVRAARPPVVEYAIYQTEYQVEIEEDIAFVRERVQLEVFKKGDVTKVPLVSADVGLKEVSLNQKSSIVHREGRQYVLLVDRPGRYHLLIEFFVKLTRERERGPGRFTFEVLPSPISLLDVQIGEPEMDLFVEPSIKLEKETVGNKTLATAVLPYTESVMVRWSPAVGKVELPSMRLEPKLYVDASTLISIGEGVAHGFTNLRYAILQSEVSNLKVLLPDDVTVLDVQAADLRDWKVVDQDDKQVVDLYLSRGVKGPYDVKLIYEKAIGEGSVTTQLPELVVLGVEREKGLVGVQAKTNVEIAFGTLTNATPIDVKELPQELWSQAVFPILLAYKYLNHPLTAEIEVTKHQEIPVLVAAIDSAHYVTLLTEEGKVLTKAMLNMRNNVKQFMRLSLPEGATFLNCFVSSQPVKPAQDTAGRVLVPLEKSETLGETVTQFPVEIMYLTQVEKLQPVGTLSLALPELDIPTSQLYWSLYLPEEFNYGWFRGDVKLAAQEMPIGFFGQLAERWQRRDVMATSPRRGQAFSQSASNLDAQIGMEQKVVQGIKGKSIGVLPIRMEMPTEGRALRFSKLLVTEERPWMTCMYLRNFREAQGVLTWVSVLIVLGLVGWAGRPGHSAAHQMLVLAGLVAVGLSMWLAKVSAGILIAAAAVGALVRLIRRKGTHTLSS